MKNEESQKKPWILILPLIAISLIIGSFLGYWYSCLEKPNNFAESFNSTSIKFESDSFDSLRSFKFTKPIERLQAKEFADSFFTVLRGNIINGKNYVEWAPDFKGWSVKIDTLKKYILEQKDRTGKIVCTDLMFHIALRDKKPTLIMTGAIKEPDTTKSNKLKLIFLKSDPSWGMGATVARDGILEWVDPCPKICPDTF